MENVSLSEKKLQVIVASSLHARRRCVTESIVRLGASVITVIILFLTAGVCDGQKVSDQQPGANASAVHLNVTVTDAKGRPISGLNQSAFVILDNNVRQDIVSFSDADEPVSIGILFAFSSMNSGPNVQRAKEGLIHSIQRNNSRNEYFLIGADSGSDAATTGAQDAEAIARQLTNLTPKGDYSIYDAVYLGLDRLQHASFRKRALVMITDGRASDSQHDPNEVRAKLADSGALLYSICFLDPIRLARKAGMSVQDTLNRLSDVSGGLSLYPGSDIEMNAVFDLVAIELRHQYSIAYRPKNVADDGKWHQIKVQVVQTSGSRAKARSKEGYFVSTDGTE